MATDSNSPRIIHGGESVKAGRPTVNKAKPPTTSQQKKSQSTQKKPPATHKRVGVGDARPVTSKTVPPKRSK